MRFQKKHQNNERKIDKFAKQIQKDLFDPLKHLKQELEKQLTTTNTAIDQSRQFNNQVDRSEHMENIMKEDCYKVDLKQVQVHYSDTLTDCCHASALF